jgi:hypothetical protein
VEVLVKKSDFSCLSPIHGTKKLSEIGKSFYNVVPFEITMMSRSLKRVQTQFHLPQFLQELVDFMLSENLLLAL